MSARLERFLFITVTIVFFLLVAGMPFAAALLLGFAWGLLAVMAAVAGVLALAGLLGMNGGAALMIIGSAAAGGGFIIGFVVRLIT